MTTTQIGPDGKRYPIGQVPVLDALDVRGQDLRVFGEREEGDIPVIGSDLRAEWGAPEAADGPASVFGAQHMAASFSFEPVPGDNSPQDLYVGGIQASSGISLEGDNELIFAEPGKYLFSGSVKIATSPPNAITGVLALYLYMGTGASASDYLFNGSVAIPNQATLTVPISTAITVTAPDGNLFLRAKWDQDGGIAAELQGSLFSIIRIV